MLFAASSAPAPSESVITSRPALWPRRAHGNRLINVAEAGAAIDRSATALDKGLAVREITLLWLRALLAQAHSDEGAYRDYRDRYRDMAKTLGYEGHIAWAEAMT